MAGAKSKSNGLRKRRRGQPKVSSSETTKQALDNNDTDGQRFNETAMILWDWIKEYKITLCVTILVVVPYSLYKPIFLFGSSILSGCP